jgi:AcrR family transcriptional regulator
MASKAELKILAAASEVFGEVGYYGVTLKDWAAKARVNVGSVYRLFETTDKAFSRVVAAAREGCFDSGKFVLVGFEERSGKQDLQALLADLLQRWYESVSRSSARLLTQAYFVQPGLRFMAGAPTPYWPFDQMIRLVATAIARVQKLDSEQGPAMAAAIAIVLTLLHFKITSASACNPKREADTVDAFVQLWLQGLPSGG